MKKSLSFAFLLSTSLYAATAAASSACPSVPVTTSPQINSLVKLKGGWPISEAQCAFLHKHNLQLHVTADAKVLSGASVAWVALRLARKDRLVSGEFMSSTHVDSGRADSSRAEELLYLSLESTIAQMDYEGAARSLDGLLIASGQKAAGKAAK